MEILEWLGMEHGVGMSSKAVALTALGKMPRRPSYPHDGDDFGRCVALLALCPDAKVGLDRLGKEGGSVWQALVPRWEEIEVAYRHDLDLNRDGVRDHKKYKCYTLMQSIIRPIEDAERTVIRGKGFNIHVE
jgi:hypothetical protein